MNLAIIGCGYVADFYMATLTAHPSLQLSGVFDQDADRLAAFCRHHAVASYPSMEHLLSDSSNEMILNLTDPRSHYEVNMSCIRAGKHVYSEKPLAMDFDAAQELVQRANEEGVYLASAPCSLLGETAQTIWKALHEAAVGPVRLVYANFECGMQPKFKPWNWRSSSGAKWPAKDEFEVGGTYEHAGYFLTWLAAFFGPAKRVTAFASCQLPHKGVAVDVTTPDFSVGCIEYGNGVVARATCGIVAPVDKSLTIVGEEGVIFTRGLRNDAAPVYIRRIPAGRIQSRLERRLNALQSRIEPWLNWIPWSWHNWQFDRKYPFARQPLRNTAGRGKRVDFCRGPAEMVEAIEQQRPCRLSAELGLHITELIEALQYPERFGGSRTMQSRFDPIQPLPWLS